MCFLCHRLTFPEVRPTKVCLPESFTCRLLLRRPELNLSRCILRDSQLNEKPLSFLNERQVEVECRDSPLAVIRPFSIININVRQVVHTTTYYPTIIVRIFANDFLPKGCDLR